MIFKKHQSLKADTRSVGTCVTFLGFQMIPQPLKAEICNQLVSYIHTYDKRIF